MGILLYLIAVILFLPLTALNIIVVVVKTQEQKAFSEL
jgi:hypothetical protein